MKKRIVSALLVLAMVLMLIPTTVFAATTYAPALSVSAERAENTVVVRVKASAYSDCWGLQLDLSFPDTKLSVTEDNIVCAGLLEGAQKNVRTDASGKVIAAAWSGTAARNSETEETILTATFSVNEGATGTLPFNISTYVSTNGDDEATALPSGSTGTASVVIPITDASSISATVAAPEKGKALATAAQATVPENAPYTVTDVKWFEGEGSNNTPVTGNAKPSQKYTVQLTVTANEGECFDYAAVHTKQSADGYAIMALGNPAESTCTRLQLTKIFTESTADADQLTGTIVIHGSDEKGVYRYNTQLEASPTLFFGAETRGEVTYQWFRGETALTERTTTATYTPVEADIDQAIKVRVWNSNNSGYVESIEVMINKALNTTPPAAPAKGSAKATSDTITVDYTGEDGKTYQFAARLASDEDSELKWQDSSTITGLDPNRDYNIYVREAETATHEPSNASTPLTVKTAKGKVVFGSLLRSQLVNSISVYSGEYDGASHTPVEVDAAKLPSTDWTVRYKRDGGSYQTTPASITNVADSGGYTVEFSHVDYEPFEYKNNQAVIAPATNYLTVTPPANIYETTTVSQIINGLNKTITDGKPATLTLPTGTVTLYKDSACTQPYADTDKFTAKTDAYTVYYKFTTENANYAEVTGSLTLNVQERGITGITVKQQPTNKTYEYGDKFDPAGMTIEVTYDNGDKEDKNASEMDFTWSALDTVGGSVTVTGTLKGTSLTVTVDGITVTRKSIAVEVSLKDPNATYTYDGTEHKPEIVVKRHDTNEVIESGYSTNYSRNKDATTTVNRAKITVTSNGDSNYNFSAELLFDIAQRTVTITGVTLRPKTFDGKAEVQIGDAGTLNNVISGDDVQIRTGTASFNSKFVDKATTVTFEGFELYSYNTKDYKNYKLEGQPAPVSAKINQVALTLSAPTVTMTKAYDGTADAQITNHGTLSGFVKDGATTYPAYLDEASCKATFDSKDVGQNKTITFTGFTLKGDFAANYTLADPTSQTGGEITAANVNARNTGKEITQLKNGAAFTEPDISGVNNETITGGTFSFKYSESDTETYTSAELATSLKGKAVGDYTVSFTYTHTNPNYVSPVTGTMTAHVRDIEFKVNGDPAGMTNTYPWDNTYGGLIYAGKDSTWATYLKKVTDPVAEVNGQKIEGTYAIKVYDASGAEVEKGFTPGHYVFKLIFNDTNGQYPNTEVWATSAAYINQAQIAVADGSASGITVKDRAYNGSDDVTASDLDMSGLVLKYVTGPLTGQTVTDTVTLAYGSAKYDSKNAGNRTVTLSTLSLNGADKDNFTLANASGSSSYKSTIELPAEITKRNVTITGTTAGEKVYDGGTSATITNDGELSWKYSTDKVEIVRGSATYDNKNVGENKTVTFSGFSLTGADAGNYNLTQQPDSVRANITAKELRITNFTVKDKVYDGNDIAEIVSIETDAVEGDDVKCSNAIARFVASGTFSASDAQNGKKVTLKFPQGVILAGADKDNYTFDSADLPDEVTATIHKATLTGQPTFTKITQSGKTLLDIKDSDVDLTAIHGVSGEPNPLYPVLIWGEDRNTVIQPNKSYSWEVKVAGASADNYLPLTGSVVLYPVSTGYSEQVKKQIEEFEAKKRGELPEEDTTFRDVSEDDYFFDAVNWAAENGITGGVSANRFGPTQDCSRGQTMTFLWRAMGEPEPASRASDLTDVMTGSYYYDAVLWAMEAGITTGAGANRFAPDATVTRGQFVTFLYRLANASSSGEHPFTDVPAGSYYEKAIAWAYAEGITKGTGATTFSPDAPCTRAQIITFLYRYFNR